ncbi:hypothetical protein Henu3_gp43 [Mycobacterium phage Henu3]|uniref:Uncharacterized protein n=1 Tax=Mycobacterium phage Henu3 TaxID=2492961 RepID=A0A410T7K1_9CAUD|nr:hypothetical protein I5G68_gp40 [Mycobacterium phage Henu3]QAU04987.1 hypothetical protein Henu3_gp43 [Mycobacterium phage Henu3]
MCRPALVHSGGRFSFHQATSAWLFRAAIAASRQSRSETSSAIRRSRSSSTRLRSATAASRSSRNLRASACAAWRARFASSSCSRRLASSSPPGMGSPGLVGGQLPGPTAKLVDRDQHLASVLAAD